MNGSFTCPLPVIRRRYRPIPDARGQEVTAAKRSFAAYGKLIPMSRTSSRRKHTGLSLAILMIGLTSTAVATTTVCSTSAYKQYHYGIKASLRFDVGPRGPEGITSEVKEFAAMHALSYSSVGGHDPHKNPPLETLDQILQDTSIALAITISTSSRSTIATASVETFSFSCGPTTKDWRPYWQAFGAFVRANGYRTVSN
jgi:hypothetical protein